MSSKVFREIPLKILHGKIEDDHVNLLQACYDNTIFNGNGTKGFPTQNGSNKTGKPQDYGAEVYEDGVESRDPNFSAVKRSSSCHVACNHVHAIQVSKPLQNEVTFPEPETGSRPVIPFLLCFVIVLAVTVGLLIYFLGHVSHSSPSSLPSPTTLALKSPNSPVITLANIHGSFSIIAGPFAMLSHSMVDTSSPAFTFIRNAFIFKMDMVFMSSDFANLYNRTQISSISENKGHIQLSFVIYVQPNVTATEELLDHLKSTLVSGFRDSLFVIDEKNVTIMAIVIAPSKGSQSTSGQCQSVQFSKCVNVTSYTSTAFPNLLGHKSSLEVEKAMRHKYDDLFMKSCYGQFEDFFCSVLTPECGPDGKPIPPCQNYCQDVMASCNASFEGSSSFPVSCDALPSSEDPSACKQNPYHPGSCVPVTIDYCLAKGFNTTAYPNALDGFNPEPNLVLIASIIQATTSCFKHSVLFSCALFTPPCSGQPYPNHFIPPCYSLCVAYRDRCGIFHHILNQHWPAPLNCSEFPDSPDPNVCVGYHEAREIEVQECGPKEIRCGKDRCIKVAWLCDGFQDCDDNSDEDNCATCGRDEQMCSPASSLCIHKSQGCDGRSDCYMDVDEHYCVRMDKELDNDVLEVYNSLSSAWEQVCKDGWTSEFSDLTCKQLGYRNALATYYVSESRIRKSMVSHARNGSDPDRLQSYLSKGHTQCASGYVVKLVCWESVCGTRPAYYTSATRVVGGDEVKPGAWPWMASLHGGSREAFFCGATIIDPQWVLTAGHCVGSGALETKDWTIKVASTRRMAYSEHIQIRRARTLYVHPEFSVSTVDNDIALIHLDRPLAMNDFVRPICLPDHGPVAGTRCFATGWGKSSHNALVYENVMRQVPVDVTSREYCRMAIIRSEVQVPYKLTANMFCAGGAHAHDACQGDSGGPLVCRKENSTNEWYQGGVVSWGLICGQPNTPGVYTNLPLYISWINQIIRNHSLPAD